MHALQRISLCLVIAAVAAVGPSLGRAAFWPVAAPYQERGQSDEAKPADAKQEGEPDADEAKQKAEEEKKKAEEEKKAAEEQAKQARERQRKRVRLERELKMAELRHTKTQAEQEHSARERGARLERLEQELEIARTRLAMLTEQQIPDRIARGELGLQWSRDSVLEAEQELHQLELMYSEDQLADKTKEIVLERGRRRLERSRRNLELAEREHVRMVEHDIPLEVREAQMGVENKAREIVGLRHEIHTSRIDVELSALSAEAEMERLRQELEDVQEEERKAAQEAAEKAAEKTADAGEEKQE